MYNSARVMHIKKINKPFLNIKCSISNLTFYKSFINMHDEKAKGRNAILNYSVKITLELGHIKVPLRPNVYV